MEALWFPIAAILLITIFYFATRIHEKRGQKDTRDIFEKMEVIREQRAAENTEAERLMKELEKKTDTVSREAKAIHPRTLKGYIQSSFEVVNRARLHIALAVIIFIVFVFIGAINFERLSVLLDPLKNLARGLEKENTFGIILGILQKNLFAMLVVMFGGIVFGIIPIFSLAVNGAIVGVAMMAGFQKGLNVFEFLAAIVPHGVFELPAIFIASGVAMRIGFMQFKCKGREPARKRLVEGMRVLFFIVFPLLVVAAVIEGLGVAGLR